jgi:hypothetical protein
MGRNRQLPIIDHLVSLRLREALLIVACASIIAPTLGMGQSLDVPTEVPSRSSQVLATPWRYIRECTPRATSAHDCAFIERLYGSWLAKLKESPLEVPPAGGGVADVYRITVITPSSKTAARMVRLEIKPDGTSEAIGKAASQFGMPQDSTSTLVSASDTKALCALFPMSTFDSLPSLDLSEPNRRIRDGQLWLVERVHDRKYHAVHRWGSLGRDLSTFADRLLSTAKSGPER